LPSPVFVFRSFVVAVVTESAQTQDRTVCTTSPSRDCADAKKFPPAVVPRRPDSHSLISAGQRRPFAETDKPERATRMILFSLKQPYRKQQRFPKTGVEIPPPNILARCIFMLVAFYRPCPTLPPPCPRLAPIPKGVAAEGGEGLQEAPPKAAGGCSP